MYYFLTFIDQVYQFIYNVTVRLFDNENKTEPEFMCDGAALKAVTLYITSLLNFPHGCRDLPSDTSTDQIFKTLGIFCSVPGCLGLNLLKT